MCVCVCVCVSILHQNGLSESDVKERIARASRAFGMLRKPIFNNRSLSVPTKRTVYRAVVLSTLLYGSETWTTKRTLTQKLESFHNRCLRGIFGITRVQQHTERISSAHVRELFGMKETIEELVMLRRMQWLGHLARMPDARMPKQILFGRLQRSRPFHGVRMRWKDRVKKDMVALTVLSHWYVAAQDRKLWHDRYCAGMERAVERRIVREWEKRRASSLLGGSSALPFTCHQCNRSFRRTGDLRRHKCDSRRSRARSGAQGADVLQCRTCHRTFRRSGDMLRHKCGSRRSARVASK